MYELGILERFLKLPHQEVRELSAQIGNETIPVADFTHLPTHCKFVALMPQWDFLDFIAAEAELHPQFHLRMRTEATDLIREGERIVGVRAKTAEGILDIRAQLTVGADGRHSVVRERAGLEVLDLGAPMDALWMRLSRKPSDPPQTFGHVDAGKMLVMLNREEYWQCAFVIPKGEFDEIRRKGLNAFREEIAQFSPWMRDRVNELGDWKDVSLLMVTVDRLVRWHLPGLLCIGDAAHAMSPIGGVGVNLAIQDAVATANILSGKLREGKVKEPDLKAVQKRRMFPTRATQTLQAAVQNRVIKTVLAGKRPMTTPWPMKLMRRWPALRRILPRIVGVGFRREHVRS